MYNDIRKYLELPDYVSLGTTVFAVASIFLSIQKNFLYSLVAIVIALVFDYYDGKVARMINRKGDFGKVLDSLNDVILYLICVAVFGYCAGLNSVYDIAAFIIFIMAGVIRLARFTIMGVVEGCYIGLPVSYSIIIPFVYFLFVYLQVDVMHLIWLYFVPSFLMVSSIKVKKKFPYF